MHMTFTPSRRGGEATNRGSSVDRPAAGGLDGAICEIRSIPLEPEGQGGVGPVRLLRARQAAAGLEPAAPRLTVRVLTRGAFGFRADFGFGAFSGIKRRGEFGVTPPDTVCEVRATDPMTRPIDILVLEAPFALIRSIAATGLGRDLDDFGPSHTRMTACDTTARLIESLWSEAAIPGPHLRLYADGALFTLTALLARHAGSPPPPRLSGGLAPWQVRRATDYLRDHLAEDVALSDLAGQVGLSPFHFARAFKASVGAPPGAYQRALRMNEARTLLSQTDAPITEIAAQVGYEAPQTLARVFRREVGVSPSRYRRAR